MTLRTAARSTHPNPQAANLGESVELQYPEPLAGILGTVPLRLVPFVVTPGRGLERDRAGVFEGLFLPFSLTVGAGITAFPQFLAQLGGFLSGIDQGCRAGGA